MKINFPALFHTPLQKVNFFFIFGNDAIVFERAVSYLQKKLALPLHIKAEEALLKAGASQLSLFETLSSSSLTLTSVTDKILTHVDQLKEGPFIFTSEKARAQSKLVTYFTQSSRALAIAAYASPLTTSEFEFLVGEMSLPVAFKGLLFKAYQNDYMGLLGALEKIKLYGEIPETAYPAFLDASPSSDGAALLLQAFLLRNVKKATEALSSLNSSDAVLSCRSLNRTFQTLFDLMPFKASPQTISWQKLTPPIFFKDQPLYESALSKWRLQEIQSLLETLLSLERRIKFSGLTLSQMSHELLRAL